jgi:hypothetical protein
LGVGVLGVILVFGTEFEGCGKFVGFVGRLVGLRFVGVV